MIVDRTAHFDDRDASDVFVTRTVRGGENDPHNLLGADWNGARNVPYHAWEFDGEIIVYWRRRTDNALLAVPKEEPDGSR